MKKRKRSLSLFLAMMLFFSCILTTAWSGDESSWTVRNAVAAEAQPSNKQIALTKEASQASVSGTAQGEYVQSTKDKKVRFAEHTEDSRIVNDGGERLAKNGQAERANRPEKDTVVDLIVVMKKPALADTFSEEEIDADTGAVRKYRAAQMASVEDLEESLEETFEEDEVEVGYTYTMALTGVSVTTRYENKEAIEALPEVDYVYLAPVYQMQDWEQEDSVKIQTSNATAMIGADQVNETGYSGKGMRIAIIDTGIVLEHPSFQPLEQSSLTEESLTEAEVDRVWKSLNAGKTTLRNAAYQNTKIPFAFNYTSMNFDVSHDIAQHDHGTHVAGIAAANRIEDSSVVGVAPDAQLLVMQVFDQSGGAGWATILAALEDCVKLNVDTVNLSLGSTAGFTDNEEAMTATLEKFKQMDIQMVVAAGNETNTGYMNRTGTNMAKKENPDHGLIGTPATASVAMSVASVDNDGADLLYFTVGEKKIGFTDSAVSGSTNFFQNHKGTSLEFVYVGGTGTAEDYEGVDVTDKVAVVERGVTSFQDKQKAAKDAGAKALIVCNNVQGSFTMVISDGYGHIPCIGVSLDDGKVLQQMQSGTLQVCSGDLVHVSMGRAMSSFSSWGVTPDMKLKPEISGVGGSIYSTRDPEIAGSNYGDMSGTSMASPQVAGAVTVLTQYLREEHKDAYQDETGLRRMAANLMMSTAEQIRYSNVEVSPRSQGAGLVNLTNAVQAGAYLSAPDTYDTRPKGEMGDDEQKLGIYQFKFQITNISEESKTYAFDSTVMTPDVAEDTYMTDTPRKLAAKISVIGDKVTNGKVTVAPDETVELTAKIQLTEADRSFIEANFTKGIYVEGFLYARNQASDGTDLSMPFLGFYGDWSEPKVFDEEGDAASMYAPRVLTNKSELGVNPYFRSNDSTETYNAVSYANPLAELDFGLLRNAKKIRTTVVDAKTGANYFEWSERYITKTYYNPSYGMIFPYSIYNFNDDIAVWDGKNHGSDLKDGTKVTYRVEAFLDDGDDLADDVYEFDLVVDNEKPQIINQSTLESGIIKDTEKGTVRMPITLQDNEHIAAIIFESPDGVTLGRYEVKNTPGSAFAQEYDVTGFGTDFTIVVADYACNETEVDVSLDLSDMPGNGQTEPRKLDQDRIYGNETFDGGVVSTGWFSAAKADFTDLKNETYDTSVRYYSGEYINGYVVAQRATDGAVVLLTPYNTWWNSRTLYTQSGTIGTEGFNVLYDMALDYSTNRLFAVGWAYAGDKDGDGKDDGKNTLFELVFKEEGNVELKEVAYTSGMDDKEALTLGCTTEGQLYVISTDGKLYALNKETGAAQYKGTTDFVKKENYSGVNVIQSMGYDHNTQEMYWFAHSQTLSGYSYINVCATYKVNLANASCTEVGSAGASGHTSLFVPTDRTSTIFEMNVNAEDFQIEPQKVTLASGQSQILDISWEPWNAKAQTVIWTSENEAVAVVNPNGKVTAVAEGVTNIYAAASLKMADGQIKQVQRKMEVEVVKTSDEIYGFSIVDYKNAANNQAWIRYSDKDLSNVTRIKGDKLWQGGAYYQGYVYTVTAEEWTEGSVAYKGTGFYKSRVTKEAGKEIVIGSAEMITQIPDIEVGNIGFDYTTGRLYGVDLTNGGLCILDIDNGSIDLLGTFNGDLKAAIMPAMCVTNDGTIVGSDMFGSLYTVNPDTMKCKKIGAIDSDTWYYAAMTYDYNTGNIYWNPCMAENASPFYMIRLLDKAGTKSAQCIKLGNVSSKAGMEQTVLFTIPASEPETNYVQVEDIKITNAAPITGLVGGSLQLKTKTTPIRPTAQAKQWSSDNEEVVSVDRFGKITFKNPGTARVTVSISNKGENVAGPFTDTIEINVYPAAGEMAAFLCTDEGASSYYDYWLKVKDYDLESSETSTRMISTYSLRTGEYYDGYFYAYNNAGVLYRISANNYSDYVTIGKHGLGDTEQIVSMAFDYHSGTMYGLTLPPYGDTGYLAKIDLTTGKAEKLYKTNKKVFAMAFDKNGVLFAAGSPDAYSTAELYTLDPQNGNCTYVQKLEGAFVYTGSNYYGETMYSSQMAYDYKTNRLYLHATTRQKSMASYNTGMFMIRLTEDSAIESVANIGKIALQLRGSKKIGDAYLGLLSFVPKKEDLPQHSVTGVILNRSSARVEAGGITTLTAEVVPSYAENKAVIWESADPQIATVDADGTVTGVKAGNVVITATSEANPKAKAQCSITVLPNSDERSVAYTISPTKESLIAFDPALPATTMRTISRIDKNGKVAGVAVKNENYLYYLVDEYTWPELYRYDMTTKQSVNLGSLQVFIGNPSDMAYDPVNKLIYVVSGFYVFQFEEERLTAGSLNAYSGYLDVTKTVASISTTQTVACKDGEVYFMVSDNDGRVYKADDKLKNMQFVCKLEVNTSAGESEMDYDSRSGKFYLTDAGDRIYTFDESGNAEMVDVLGNGWEMNGLAIYEEGKLPESPVEPTPDPLKDKKERLQQLADSVKAIYESKNADSVYTPESWEAFAEAYEAAVSYKENITEKELDDLITNLQNTKDDLKEATPDPEPNPNPDPDPDPEPNPNPDPDPEPNPTPDPLKDKKEQLQQLADSAKTLYESKNADSIYTPESWEAFAEAYEAAVSYNEDIAEKELDDLIANLQNAKDGLKETTPEPNPDPDPDPEPNPNPNPNPDPDPDPEPNPTPDPVEEQKKLLQDAVDALTGIYEAGNKEERYTEEVWKAFEEAYRAATSYGEEATEEELRDLIENLQKAQKALTNQKPALNPLPKPEPDKRVLAAPSIVMLKASAKKDGVQVKIKVSAVEGADSYEIYRVSENKTKKIGTAGEDRIVIDTQPKHRTASYYAVAVSSDKKLRSEAGISKKLKLAAKVKIRNVKRKSNGIWIRWKKREGAKKYVIYRSEKKYSGYVRIKNVSRNQNTYLDTTAKKGKKYYYRIVNVTESQASILGEASKGIKR